MTIDFCALCAELVDVWDAAIDQDLLDMHEAVERVRTALAQPSPEGELTDEELGSIAADRARRPAPEPPAEGEVGELVAALRQAAQNLTPHPSIVPLEAVRFTRAAELLERLSPPQPVPVAWCRTDEFTNAMKRGGSFNGWKDPGAGSNKCDMQLFALPLPSPATPEAVND